MRISTKGRYALAAAVCMAQRQSGGDYITAISISEKLGISKIYLEQVFALLKRGGIVLSGKGAQGGYLLARSPAQITAFEVLASVESALFDETEETVPGKAPDIESAMQSAVFESLDRAVKTTLTKVTLEDLVAQAQSHDHGSAHMFYI